MKEFIVVLQRFLPPYRRNLIMSVIYNLLSAFFSGLAMVFMIPILNVLFDSSSEVLHLLPWALTKEALANNLYFYVTLVKNEYGVALVIPFIGALMLVTTLLKVGFAFLASFEIVGIRNGVVRNNFV